MSVEVFGVGREVEKAGETSPLTAAWAIRAISEMRQPKIPRKNDPYFIKELRWKVFIPVEEADSTLGISNKSGRILRKLSTMAE